MKITIERILLIIIILLLVFNQMCRDDKSLFDYLESSNEELQLEIDAIKKLVEAQKDSVIRIDSTILVTKNHYIIQDEEIKKITTDSAAVAVIRNQLARLRSAGND